MIKNSKKYIKNQQKVYIMKIYSNSSYWKIRKASYG